MTLPAKTALAFVLMTTAASAEQPPLLGGVAAGTYTEQVREEIFDFQLISHPAHVAHPHEIVVGPLAQGSMVHCALYDSTGTAVTDAHEFQRGGPVRLFFDTHVPDATARCAALTGGRQVRPSTGGVTVNRLVSVAP